MTFLKKLLDEHGDVVRYQSRFGPCFVFVNPVHVQAILHDENYRRASLVKMMLGDGLLATDGPYWRSQRRLMQRNFLPPGIEPMVANMVQRTSMLAEKWNAAARARQSINVMADMTRLTLQIVVESLFSNDLPDGKMTDLCAAVTQTIEDLGEISWTIFGTPMHFAPGASEKFAAGRKVIDQTCYEMISARRAMPQDQRPRDLLTLLIESGDGSMSDRQLRDEIVTMLVGGHETTALALSWAWKLLAENPQVESQLHDELDQTLQYGPPSMENLARLSLSRAVFQESMRLYPPVWYMARVANEEAVVDGHPIPRGACIMVTAWFTHRHSDYWPDPERFMPQRFIDPNVLQHRYAYFPFGGGRHQCLGMHFANIEGAIILATLARQFRVVPLVGQEVRPMPGITLRQSPPLRAVIELRNSRQVTSLPRSRP
ncbi:MAG TPA: cytochrome P450 [Tepidisphaeraceae bacterium]|nr:cytochrome P450 [Tepidisphaeraceae bacterium]